MKITIVTICYNAMNTIERTFQSVFSQNYADLEYIVVDGGSNDSTLDIIKKYDDKLSQWISEKDKGISDAFNKGIKMATGEVICLVNADDELAPGTLEYVANHMKADTDVLHSDIFVRHTDGRCILHKPDLDYTKLVKKCMTLYHPGMFIRKSAYEKYGLYSLEYKCVMDRELLSRMYLAGARFQYVDRANAYFGADGISTKRYLKTVLPETTRISINNHASFISWVSYYIYRYARVTLGKIKWAIIKAFKNHKAA